MPRGPARRLLGTQARSTHGAWCGEVSIARCVREGELVGWWWCWGGGSSPSWLSLWRGRISRRSTAASSHDTLTPVRAGMLPWHSAVTLL